MFATTQWSLVLAAGDDCAEARAALEQLCRIYRPAVLAWIRCRGYPQSDAEDLTQAFFARFIENRVHAAADPARGRFRAYLRVALQRFVLNASRFEHAQRRHAPALAGGLEADALADTGTDQPDAAFERAWALATIERARLRLRREAEAAGKGPLYQHLQGCLLEPPGREEYARIAAELSTRPNTVAVAVHRLRQRLRQLVIEEIRPTVADPGEVEAEYAALAESMGTLAGRG